ncbi:MAG: glycerol-3-phosphate 1-O-acyltransferase PlsY [Bacteroidetes bacterium]|nr:glycerol-3-phosphate 1-O-acyltransferase PlsY [Bacteroidota bacterium]
MISYNWIIYPIIGYLMGSIPTAVWVGRKRYGVDVREHGSKNAGATNTFRVLGKKPGVVVLTIDVFKGLIATIIPIVFVPDRLGSDILVNIQLLTCMACVLGHVFPIFANFDGGKGVATSLGVIIGLHPPAALIALSLFLLFYLLFSYVSLGAIVAAISFPLLLIFSFHVGSINLLIFASVLSLAVILAHRKNIVRLINGTESKMPMFKKTKKNN